MQARKANPPTLTGTVRERLRGVRRCVAGRSRVRLTYARVAPRVRVPRARMMRLRVRICAPGGTRVARPS